jgi:hypothetical protein
MRLLEIPLFTVSDETSTTDSGGMKPPVISPYPEGMLLNAENILTIDGPINFDVWRRRLWRNEVESNSLRLMRIDMVGGSYGKLFYTTLTREELLTAIKNDNA